MVFITEGFFEVAIESWPEWDLNPRPLIKNAFQLLYLIFFNLQVYSSFNKDLLIFHRPFLVLLDFQKK